MSRLFWSSDEAWAAIEPHLPNNRPRARGVDDRRVISCIPHVLKTVCRWKDCPAEYGPPMAQWLLDAAGRVRCLIADKATMPMRCASA